MTDLSPRMLDLVSPDPQTAKTRLAEFVAKYWPEVRTRLGDLLGAFVDTVQANAASYQITSAPAAARFFNICCALGPNFERKPENEWALAILADERLGEWVKLHQLVTRASTELKARLAVGSGLSDALLRADRLILDELDATQAAASSEAVRLPRLSCDLEAVDLRLLEVDWRREYQHVDGAWQLVPVAAASLSIRVVAGTPAPPVFCVLTHPKQAGPWARLQIRLLTHSLCNPDHHPLVEFAGEHGMLSWRGHQARAVSWLVESLPQTPSSEGLGAILIEQSHPATSLLRASTCGLRDAGVPVGSVQTFVWAYPADQWLFALQRPAQAEHEWPRVASAASGQAKPATRLRLERDGVPVGATRWVAAFDEALDEALLVGLDGLFAGWQTSTTDASMRATTSLMAGTASLTWGWREAVAGLGERPIMRVEGSLDLVHAIDWVFTGEVLVGGTRTRVRLLAQGEVPWRRQFQRTNAEPGLLETLLPLALRWQIGWRLEFDPVATEDGVVWSEAGPCSGTVTGEVGLRPRTGGGNGWQWFARLESEPVSVQVCLHDPVLGRSGKSILLLPAVKVLDWSAG